MTRWRAHQVTIRAALGVWLIAVLVSACSRSDTMLGMVLESSDAALSFELQDQFGELVALADYGGKVVALTFLYTYCPDICPVVAGHLQRTHQMLGDDSGEVAFVAVVRSHVEGKPISLFAEDRFWAGLLAALAGKLAAAGIGVNVVSAYYHDHLFVPAGEAERALALLRQTSIAESGNS